MAASFEAQRLCGLEVPRELYVDGAYLSAAALAEAAEEHRELLGPARASAGRENLDPAFRMEAFEVEIAPRRAICSSGPRAHPMQPAGGEGEREGQLSL